jgi:antitoxin ParD1/3/4
MHFLPTRQQESWIKAKVDTGDYANASEVLREAIREKMERERLRETKLQALKTALEEGEQGPFVPLDIEQIIRDAEIETANPTNTGQSQ